MKTLLILRHAKSSWKHADLADHDRPLNKRGKCDAPQVGKLLREQELTPDLILSSTARRARATAELVAEESGYEGEIALSRDLYAAEPQAYIEALVRLPDSYARVMIVGHNPGLEELLEMLTDQNEPLPTAALAQVQLPIRRWSELSEETQGKLVGIWRPKET
jgi:phosphohistidine phosphatase